MPLYSIPTSGSASILKRYPHQSPGKHPHRDCVNVDEQPYTKPGSGAFGIVSGGAEPFRTKVLCVSNDTAPTRSTERELHSRAGLRTTQPYSRPRTTAYWIMRLQVHIDAYLVKPKAEIATDSTLRYNPRN